MQQQSGRAPEADNAGAVKPSPIRRKAKQSRKLTVRLSEQLYSELAAATDRPGVGKSMVVEAALASFIHPRPAVDDPARQRIEDLHARFDTLERNLSTIAEMVTLHARYHLAVVPPLPQERQKEACQLGDERFKILAEQVNRRVCENKPLLQETVNRIGTASQADPTICEMEPERPEKMNVREDMSESGNNARKTTLPSLTVVVAVTDLTSSAVPNKRAEAKESIARHSMKRTMALAADDQSGTEHELKAWKLILAVFLPFAAGYYLSFLFRTINAAISPALAAEFGLDAQQIGLMTAVYFLVLAGVQLPIGAFLDRYGPRRVQAVLLVLAAGGASLFGNATGFSELLFGRALIGLGVAASLMAGLKATVMWFPRDRLALVNGCMIMLGSLGAVTATAPTDWLLQWAGWRSLFELLTLVTVAVAGVVYIAVPEKAIEESAGGTSHDQFTVWSVFADARFLRIAPLSAICIGSSWSLQSLWAAPWFADVEGFDRASLMTRLFIMALALSLGALTLGILADRLRKRGITAQSMLAIMAGLFVVAELVIILRLPMLSLPMWCLVSVMGSATVLSYAIIADYFPQQLAARANGALNLVHFVAAFAVQYGIGLVVGQWLPKDGHYPEAAYQVAFGIILFAQVLALIWFAIPWFHRLAKHLWGLIAAHADREFVTPITPQGGILDDREATAW